MKKALALTSLIAFATVAHSSNGRPDRPWTLMVYGAADNNADGPILNFLNDVREALDDDPGMELVLFIDRAEGFSSDSRSLGADFHGARVYRLRKETAELVDADDFFPGMSAGDLEVDSADPSNIGKFVALCKERFPARRYGLMIYSHADGSSMCPDEESGREMGIPELTDVVGEEASVDFLALELCNMAGIEIAYQWRPGNGGFSADVLVAIPNAGPPLDWNRAFARIRSEGHATDAEGFVRDPANMTAEQFGLLVVEEGYRGRRAMAKRFPQMAARIGSESAGAFDLRQAATVKDAIDALAVTLAESDAKETFEGLRDPGEKGVVMNYAGDDFGVYPYVDAFELCKRAAECEDLTADARKAAKKACDAVDSLVLGSFGMDDLKGFEPGKNGIFITFPDGDAMVSGGFLGEVEVWRALDWYTPLDSGDNPDGPYGRWAFLADGATAGNGRVENWFELLDSWFDDTSEGPEGFNRYAY